MNRPRVVVTGAIALLFGLGVIAWRSGPASFPSASRPEEPASSVRISEGNIVLRHKGNLRAKIRAARVTVSSEQRYAVLSGVAQAAFYDRGFPLLTVSADKIILDRISNDLSITGAIGVTSVDSIRLVAPQAQWIHAAQQLVFPKGVRITSAEYSIRARRLVLDTQLMTFDLAGDVDISFRLPSGPP